MSYTTEGTTQQIDRDEMWREAEAVLAELAPEYLAAAKRKAAQSRKPAPTDPAESEDSDWEKEEYWYEGVFVGPGSTNVEACRKAAQAKLLEKNAAAAPTSHKVTESHTLPPCDSVTPAPATSESHNVTKDHTLPPRDPVISTIEAASREITATPGFTEKQLHALDMLANGMNCTDTAKALGIARETVSRWKNLPHFQSELMVTAQDVRDTLRSRLLNLTDMATKCIEADMRSDDKYAVRYRLDTSFRILQLMAYSRVVALDQPMVIAAAPNGVKQQEQETVGAHV